MNPELMTPIATGAGLLLGGLVGYLLVRRTAAGSVREAEQRAATIVAAAEKEADALTRAARTEAETLRKAAIVEGKEALSADRAAFERETQKQQEELRERERELAQRDKQLGQRETELDRLRQRLDRKEDELDARLKDIEQQRKAVEAELEAIDRKREELEGALEKVAGLSRDEARQQLLEQVAEKARLDAARVAREIEEQARETAEREAQKILATAVNRFSGEYIAERTVSVVPIPDDQMKGRIIGREGRNIRTFELITGTDLIIDDSPDHVVISCHNALRREIAKQTLLRLIEDGRIQPGRIEEVFSAVSQETEKQIRDAGQQAVFDLGLQGLHPELVRLMGMNKFRTSYSQNVLLHSIEVSYFCGMMADELGIDRDLARRCGFLHDIGKAIDHEFEGSHQAIGAELCRKFGESDEVVTAVAEHHDDPPSTIYGVLVQAADTLSAARPGARRETVTNYIKRMEDLERIATQHSEVRQAYAIQSGRELRVMLDAERTTDDTAYQLSKSVAAQIQAELKYPGQIKVTVLRQMRATAYAK